MSEKIFKKKPQKKKFQKIIEKFQKIRKNPKGQKISSNCGAKI